MELFRGQIEMNEGDIIKAGSFFSENLDIALGYDDIIYCINVNNKYKFVDAEKFNVDIDDGIVENSKLSVKGDFLYSDRLSNITMSFCDIKITKIIEIEENEEYKMINVEIEILSTDINKAVEYQKNNKEYNLR